MRRLKTGAWRPPPVSKNDLGVGTPLVAAEREWDFSFCRDGPFSLRMRSPIPVSGLWEFLHILIIILIQFNFNLFIYSLHVHVGKVYWINVPIVGQSKEDEKLTLLTYMCAYVYICGGS